MIAVGSGVFACGMAVAVFAGTSMRRVAGLATAGAGALLALLGSSPDAAAGVAVLVFSGVPLAVVATFALYLVRLLWRRAGARSLADEIELG